MPRRPRPNGPRKETPLERSRGAYWRADANLRHSMLGPLLERVTLVECPGTPGDPEYGAVSAASETLLVNPHGVGSLLGPEEWTYVLAHLLLHLGFEHEARGRGRDPVPWSAACELAVDAFLDAAKLGRPPPGWGFAPGGPLPAHRGEDELYEALAPRRAEALAGFRTAAGPRRLDVVGPVTGARRRRPAAPPGVGAAVPHAELLARGVRAAAQLAVDEASGLLAYHRPLGPWAPGEEARRRVLRELPLLGALAARLRLVADADLCRRMGIAVAAVDPHLGEIYLNPSFHLSPDELLFVYSHEVLHVALMHHARRAGRDPHVWNLACDFVINGWLVEMGVGALPRVGALYDPRLKGASAEDVYDLLAADPRRCKGLRGPRGELGDILLDGGARPVPRGDATALDDLVRRCLSAGLDLADAGRGVVPAGLLEEIRSLFTLPVPWDVELGRWFDAHVPFVRERRRSYARASRRQASTPDIPRPARYVPLDELEACTFGVVLDTSGSMDRDLLGRALGAIASFADAREVPAVRLVSCDAAPFDHGFVPPAALRGAFAVRGRGGTVLQRGVSFLCARPDLPATAPVMILTDGFCEQTIYVPRPHCFVLPRVHGHRTRVTLRTDAPVFHVLKEISGGA